MALKSEVRLPERGMCFVTEHIVPDIFRALRHDYGVDEVQYHASLAKSGV